MRSQGEKPRDGNLRIVFYCVGFSLLDCECDTPVVGEVACGVDDGGGTLVGRLGALCGAAVCGIGADGSAASTRWAPAVRGTEVHNKSVALIMGSSL